MESTVIGLYAEHSKAQDAQNTIIARFSQNDIELILVEKSDIVDENSSLQLGSEKARMQSQRGDLFAVLLGGWFVDGENEQDYHPEYHADIFAAARNLGGYLLAVQSKNHSQQMEIVNILDHFSPMEISDRKAHWHVPAEVPSSDAASALHA